MLLQHGRVPLDRAAGEVAQPALVEPLRQRVKRHEARGADEVGLFEELDLRVVQVEATQTALDLAAEHDLAATQLGAEVVLASEPHREQVAGLVAGDRLDPLEPAPRRERADVPDRHDDRDEVADLELGDLLELGVVDVAAGEVEEQIARRLDAEPGQPFGVGRADPGEPTDGRR